LSERAGSRPPQRPHDHRPARQRHRAPQRATTPLTQLTDAVTDQLGDARRTGAIAVISTGLVAGVALPAQGALGGHPATSPATTGAGPATVAAPAYSSLSARPLTAGAALGTGAALSAPRAAVVSFETGAFTALPKPPPPKPAPAPRPVVRKAAVAKPATAEPTTRREAREARELAATRAAAARQRAAAEQRAAEARRGAEEARKRVEAKRKAAEAKKKAADSRKKAPAPKKGTGTGGSAVKGSSVLAIAARYVGTPYRYGGTTPRGFDCSGYTRYVFAKLGISLPRTANQQMNATRRIKRSQARPGDLVFFVSSGRAYHMGIYAGNGMMYDSPRSGKSVSKRKIWDAAVVFGRVRG
jgi:cell wall-associated NlpC family hydrolase